MSYFVYNIGLHTEWRPLDMINSKENIYFSIKAINVSQLFLIFYFHIAAFTEMPNVSHHEAGLSFNQKIKSIDYDQNSHIFTWFNDILFSPQHFKSLNFINSLSKFITISPKQTLIAACLCYFIGDFTRIRKCGHDIIKNFFAVRFNLLLIGYL